MEKIEKFKAIDGKEFTTEGACVDYENLIKEVEIIMGVIQPRPKDDGCDFVNGGGYIQHDKETLSVVRRNLLNVIKRYINHKWVQQTIDDENVHPSYVDRLVGDYNISPLNDAWHRFNCIDKEGREYGQPYFVANPDKIKGTCLSL